ncbi:MAG TPA: DivIVA domain-containing protein [Rubrobacteraceae bacterium]|nr:DivIVA domain-containing protein [Rubrobacteraceae bacterium]
MPIRPIDVRRKEFKNSFRGYDSNQVDDFLDAVADEFERAHTENSRMREEISSLRARLQQFEELEGSIRAALVHAEQAAHDLRRSASREAEDLRLSAQREADLTVREAQSRSHQMLAESSSRVERIQESFEALQEAKRNFASDFRHLLKSYTDVMDQAEVASAREVEAALRGRLDTESIAIAREAASNQGAASDRESVEYGPTTAGSPPLLDEEEPQATDDTGALDAEAPQADAGGLEQETAYLEQETAFLDRETAYLEQEQSEPETVEPEIDPSTAPATADEETAVYDEPAHEEPEVAHQTPPDEEPEKEGSGFAEEPALAEESRSQDFFDQSEESSSQEGSGNSRIFRASRFLRRRE